jgi:small-conductance mechanosensitive channel/CRP-like cAMP-binding protein
VLRAHGDKLLWVVGVFVAIVVTAALVNRFRPIQRPRLRRLVTVFALFATATATGIGFDAAQLPTWSSGCLAAAEVLQAFTLISLTATLVFAIVLPSVGLELPMIASDLIVGLGYVVVALVILARHGVNPTSALVSGAVVSAVLAISLQSTLGNIVGGVALQLDGSVREGDWIQLDNGKQGRVRSVRWRHTVLETRDWSTIIVPNSLLLATTITILGKREGRSVPQRMVIGFNIDFRFAPTQVIEVVTDALRASAIDNVATDPPPDVVCMDFAKDGKDSYATYAARYWLVDLASDDRTSSRVRARIYAALQRARIPLAVPARTSFVELKDDARAALRAERQIDERFAALKTVHLFRTLTDAELRTLAAGMIHVMYTDGELITRQGAAAHWLYVMTDGDAEIRTHFDPTPNDAAQLIDPTTPLPHAAHDATRPPGEAPNRAAQRAGIDHLGSARRRGDADRKETVAIVTEASPRPARPARGESDQKVRVAQLTAPDFFGEMSLMTGAPRSADVIAIGDVDCFRLGKDTFKTVLLARPEIATELSAKLASRRVELMAARGAIDPASRSEREASERDRILGGIKAFFALD